MEVWRSAGPEGGSFTDGWLNQRWNILDLDACRFEIRASLSLLSLKNKNSSEASGEKPPGLGRGGGS